jgi:L-arabinose isomerase
MNESRRPRLGVLGLMLGAYEPIFPGIVARQERWLASVLEGHSDLAEFTFPGAALDRPGIEERVAAFNREDLDGILIFLLTYSQGLHLVRAMQDNRLPLALALVQPDDEASERFEELDLTVNQGIHGAQDNANALLRAGIPCAFFAGSRLDSGFGRFVDDFAQAARTARALRRMRIAVVGRLAGMGDVVGDDAAFFRKVGPELVLDSVGNLYRYVSGVSDVDVAKQVARDREIFEIDPKLGTESHEEAARLYLGIRRWLVEGGYAGYTAHFEEFAADGRFCQLPLLAASHLMAEGYGYAAEGDGMTAALVATVRLLSGNVNFSEMYMMDFERNAILFSHQGEGNWATGREDRKPRLIDRFLGEGGLSNPPTPIFMPEPGPATVAAIVHIGGERFRIVASCGDILDEPGLPRCEQPHFFFRPSNGVRIVATRWLELGASHHEAIAFGDIRGRLERLCRILDIEYAEV